MLPTGPKLSLAVKTKPDSDSEAVAVFVAEGATDAGASASLLTDEQQKAVARLLASGAARGKLRDVQQDLVEAEGSKKPRYRRVLVVGLGKPEKLTAETVRQAAGALARAGKRARLNDVAIALPALVSTAAPLTPATVAEAIATGLLLASFDYDEYKGTASKRSEEDGAATKQSKARSFAILVRPDELSEARAGISRGQTICEGQNFARTIASRPGNNVNPPVLAGIAEELAKEVGLGCRVMDEKQLAKLKMGGILAVGAGAIETPPRMIVLEWKGTPKKGKPAAPVLVVGKSITFDTGGISIKPADKMGKMIFDKCGGMAVLGLMYAVAKLKLPVHVVGILSSAENAISSKAYRPGDILRMYNGVTVDVTNTDAEGRLVLGDALAWGIETYKPSAVVDLATLTGAMVVALGYVHAGIFCNNDALTAELTSASESAGEKVWRMPLAEAYRERIKADAADIVNASGRDGGCCTAAAFLSYFVPTDGSVPWAHMDIAGVADTEKELPYYAKGSTGWGVRTLVEWISRRADPRGSQSTPPPAGG